MELDSLKGLLSLSVSIEVSVSMKILKDCLTTFSRGNFWKFLETPFSKIPRLHFPTNTPKSNLNNTQYAIDLKTDLVITGTSHVTDPLHSLVGGLLVDL